MRIERSVDPNREKNERRANRNENHRLVMKGTASERSRGFRCESRRKLSTGARGRREEPLGVLGYI